MSRHTTPDIFCNGRTQSQSNLIKNKKKLLCHFFFSQWVSDSGTDIHFVYRAGLCSPCQKRKQVTEDEEGEKEDERGGELRGSRRETGQMKDNKDIRERSYRKNVSSSVSAGPEQQHQPDPESQSAVAVFGSQAQNQYRCSSLALAARPSHNGHCNTSTDIKKKKTTQEKERRFF